MVRKAFAGAFPKDRFLWESLLHKRAVTFTRGWIERARRWWRRQQAPPACRVCRGRGSACLSNLLFPPYSWNVGVGVGRIITHANFLHVSHRRWRCKFRCRVDCRRIRNEHSRCQTPPQDRIKTAILTDENPLLQCSS